MVVQCPSCQSRFRVADEKVTDRGVRVRCTICKNVFPVKKGAGEPEEAAKRPAAGPIPPKGDGKRLDIDDLFGMDELVGESTSPLGRPKTGPVSKPGTGPVPTSKPSTGPITEPVTGPTSKRGTGPIGKPRTGPVSKPGTGPISKPLTGPIAKPSTGPVASRPSTGPVSKPATGPVSGRPPTGPQRARAVADDLDLDLDLGPAPAPKRPAAQEPPDPAAGAADDSLELADPTPAAKEDLFDLPPTAGAANDDAFDAPPPKAKKQSPAAPPSAHAPRPAPAAREEKKEPRYKSIFRKPAEPPRSTRRELISSALTGLVGASLAIVVMFVVALSDENSGGWLGYGARDDLVATRIASGVYDTAAGVPVLFVRGKVQNRGKTPRGVRVVAELVGDSGVAAKTETIAGSEPGPEDVYALASAADADRLMRSLTSGDADRTVAPGKTVPFFAVFPDAPQDLQGHKLRVRFEPVEAAPRHRSAQRAR